MLAPVGTCRLAYDPGEMGEEDQKRLEALLLFLEDEPALGRLAVVESLSAGAKALEMRRGVIARMVAAVDAAVGGSVGCSFGADLTAEGVVGGVCSVVHDRLLSRRIAGFVDLANPLMSMIVLPYLGRPRRVES